MLKDDNLLISEPGSNDLVLLSTKFEEMKRLKGIPGDTLDMEGIRSSSTSNDNEQVLWFQGGNRVSLVNTSNLDITNIITGPGRSPFYCRVPPSDLCYCHYSHEQMPHIIP